MSSIQLKKKYIYIYTYTPDMQKSRQNMTNNRRKYNQQKQTQAPYTLVSTLDSETDTEMTEMPELSDKDLRAAMRKRLQQATMHKSNGKTESRKKRNRKAQQRNRRYKKPNRNFRTEKYNN